MPRVPDRSRGNLLVFVHIPKTAGSTLRTVLSTNEPGERSRALGNVFKGGGGMCRELITRLRNGKGPDLRGAALVRGHFPLGIREYLPDYMPKSRDLACFTFLRDPVERTVSHFFTVRGVEHGYRLPPLPADASIEDALELGYVHDNLQTRMLCGDPEPFGEVTEEMLEQAKQNLNELVLIGLTERFDESLVLAKRRLGLRSILYKASGRVNQQRPRGADIPAKLRRAAEAANRFDIELYESAKQLFDSAPEREELDFEIDLAALRAARDAKDNGAFAVTAPAPAGFGGDEGAWRTVIEAKAAAELLEWELAVSNVRITAARSRAQELNAEIERLKRDTERLERLEAKFQRLKHGPPRAPVAEENGRSGDPLDGSDEAAAATPAEAPPPEVETPQRRAKRERRERRERPADGSKRRKKQPAAAEPPGEGSADG